MSRALIFAAILSVLPGCGLFSDDVPEGTLKLQLVSKSGDFVYKIEALEIFDFPESQVDRFELRGEGITIVGTLPPTSGLDQLAGWQTLEGHHLFIKQSGGDPQAYKTSTVEIPGFGPGSRFLEDEFDGERDAVLIDKVSQDGGQFIVSGRLRFRLDTDQGPAKGIGAYKVRASASAR
ncbi:MAG: hypothetical protein HYY16_04240 [Planctomycetes bacterium]|nr:hypothetical protein [Planctomycetota bacterium]